MNIQFNDKVIDQVTAGQAFLGMLGTRVRAARSEANLTRKALSGLCGVSERHLAQVETGKGNISIRLLRQIALAVETPIENLVREDQVTDEYSEISQRLRKLDSVEKTELLTVIDQWMASRHNHDKAGRIALIGLRGAGKSTIGKLVAEKLDVPFIELDEEIEKLSGHETAEIFSLYGEQRYRELERECLNSVIENNARFILAVAGGIVSEIDTYSVLLRSCHTVWITAEPEEHMGRVMSQGDRRPVDGNPDAMKSLKTLLESRTPLYQRAHFRVDTSGRKPAECTEQLISFLQAAGEETA